MGEWWARFRSWVTGRAGIADDLAEEVRSHLEMEVERNIERGMEPATARAEAGRRFGNPTLIAEAGYDAWGFPSLESLIKDVRYGLRAMRRAPAFSLVVILTLALGVGVNTAIFSVVRAVLLKPLPYPAAERLVWFGEATAKAPGISVTWVNFQHWRAENHTFEEMAAFKFAGFTLTGPKAPVVVRGLTVTNPYFALLGKQPLLGRFFTEAEDRPGAEPVVVLNHNFWSNQLGGDPHIVGTSLTLDGTPYEVIGVAAPQWESWRVDCYLPLGRIFGNTVDRSQHGSIRVLGRLKPDVTMAAARTDLDAIMRHLAEVDPGPEKEHRSFGRFLAEYATGDVRGTLLIVMAAAALILLIACANVASLLLARNTTRTGEFALRRALGAAELRVVRQLLTENIVLAAAGGIAGIGVAYAALRPLLAMAPTGIPRLADTTIDFPVLLFASAITLAAGLIAGVAPIVLAGKVDLTSAIKESSRGSGGSKRRQTVRNMLVIAEVALTFVLAFGSGLLIRSLIAAETADPGFEARHVLSFGLQLSSPSYNTDESVDGFYSRLIAELGSIPGVIGASMVHCAPGAGDCGDWFYSIPGRPAPPQNEVPIALFNSAGAGYFATMRIPIRAGREFNETDRAGSPKVAIVNETLARTWWPNESAVGRQIKVGGPYLEGALLEVVGVTGDLRQFGLDSKPMVEIFLPAAQKGDQSMTVMVRSLGDTALLAGAIRGRVLALDRSLPVQRLALMEDQLNSGLAQRRFITLLLTIFAGLAMALAAIGIYGLLSYWVSVREQEIAIRLALGARPSMILRWTGVHALRLAAAGIAFGTLGGWAAARGLEDLVFGIPARSPGTLIAAGLAVAMLALASTAVPALRAARTDAASRLHHS